MEICLFMTSPTPRKKQQTEKERIKSKTSINQRLYHHYYTVLLKDKDLLEIDR